MMSTLTQWNIAKDLVRGFYQRSLHTQNNKPYTRKRIQRYAKQVKLRDEIFRLHEARWYENRSEL